MRVSHYIREELKKASNIAFGECELILFGSRVDESKKGGDFDIALVKDISKKDFDRAKIEFFKYFILKDLDLPIDLVLYGRADKLLKKEISKGEIL